ncbi:MAG: DUF134 domain-containing protein [Bacteroidales bacterium]|nr:DUF134 domain-containing protein [Bacteroidales bacterium]
MARPEKERIIHNPPMFSEFKPVGIAGSSLIQTILSLDEYEAFRLADFVGLPHIEAADEMEISRSTFTRLIEKARKKIADFIILGTTLTIGGGTVHFRHNIIQCKDCGHMFKINFEKHITECPSCHSKKILNMAASFGHGRCCI